MFPSCSYDPPSPSQLASDVHATPMIGSETSHRYFTARGRLALSLGLATGFAATCYTFFALLWSLALVLDDDTFDMTVVRTAALVACSSSVIPALYAYRRAWQLNSHERHSLTVATATSVGLFVATLIMLVLYGIASEYVAVEPSGIWRVLLGLPWLLLPVCGFYAYRRALQRATDLHSATTPNPRFLAQYYRAGRRAAMTIGITAGIGTFCAPTFIVGLYVITTGVAFDTAATEIAGPSGMLALLCAPTVGFLAYRRALRLTGLVLWLRPFHRGDQAPFAHLMRAACCGVARCITMQDTLLKRSLFAGISSRWILTAFVIPLWLLGVALVVTIAEGAAYATASALTGEPQPAMASVQTYRIWTFAIGIISWTTCYCALLFVYFSRYGVVTLEASRADDEAMRLVRHIRRGGELGGGMHILRCHDAFWRRIVTLVMRHADVVIIDVTHLTESIIWEVGQALATVPPQRLVLTCHAHVSGLRDLPRDITTRLAQGIGHDLGACSRLVLDESASRRPQRLEAIRQLRDVIQQARFEYDRDEDAKGEQSSSDSDERPEKIEGWLLLPVGELFVSCVLYGVWAVAWIAVLTLPFEIEMNIRVGIDDLVKILWWYCLKDSLLFSYSLYLIRGPLARRARAFITHMVVWFSVRILCAAIELYAIVFVLSAGPSAMQQIAWWLTLSVPWFMMSVYLVRSRRTRRTFKN